jgi:hypothetical protein
MLLTRTFQWLHFQGRTSKHRCFYLTPYLLCVPYKQHKLRAYRTGVAIRMFHFKTAARISIKFSSYPSNIAPSLNKAQIWFYKCTIWNFSLLRHTKATRNHIPEDQNQHGEISDSHIGEYASIIRAIIVLMMEAVSTSETMVNFYQTTRHNIPEDSFLQNQHLHRRENSKSQTKFVIFLKNDPSSWKS